ncbi:replication initiation protein [Acidovorax sp. sic0104]|uniref:replication initiation protein n=1 Tax=Acidovorax sp. sic0104 TaxID=2854784 RepID=UPI001C43A1C0|nr:replication initiation protein [Acidovorax sp. sic0104]MBV7542092.1 replication initiation protein [Acidovorax sp. sic0104]
MRRTSSAKTTSEGQIQLFRFPEVPEHFKKPVEVVHSRPHSQMSLVHRKLLSAWLKNAVETNPDKDGWWTLAIVDLAESIGFDSNNRDHLSTSARELMSIVFEWDVMAETRRRSTWKASVLFPDVEISSGSVRYRISTQLQEKVLSPEIYALIDQRAIRQFRRGSSIGLYEFCIRYQKLPKTAEVPWEVLRDMIMGASAEAKSYQQYKVFKDKVLKPGIAEVNSIVDMQIQLEETTRGRKVVSVFFHITHKQPAPEQELSAPEDLADVAAMVSMGLPQSEATKLARTYGHTELAAAIDYTRKRMGAKDLKELGSPAAYLRRALLEKWVPPGSKSAEKSPPKLPAKKKAAPGEQSQLLEACLAQRDGEAKGYFNELDPSEQKKMLEEYNAQQEIASLRIKAKAGKAPGKAATASFFRWLSIKTWGPVTKEHMLAYAENLVFGSKE